MTWRLPDILKEMPESAIVTTRIKNAARALGGHVAFLLEPTVFYFADMPPEDAVAPAAETWTCMFRLMKEIQSGQPACFSAARPGCVGAASYLGFKSVPVVPAAFFLSHKERLKKDAALAAAFYSGVEPAAAVRQYLVMQRLADVADDRKVEVVNLWLTAGALSVLHTLANYDRAANDNVIMPFGSGCQSIWTLPYKEKWQAEPKAIVGSLDPTVRRYLPADAMSFSAPAGRFVEMCGNIEGSFMTAGKEAHQNAGQEGRPQPGESGARIQHPGGSGTPGTGIAEDDMQLLEPARFNARLLDLSAILRFFSH